MNDQLHTAGLIKEALQDELLLRWNHAQRPERCAEIIRELGCSRITEAGFPHHPFRQILPGIALRRLASIRLVSRMYGFEALLSVEPQLRHRS